MAYDTRDTERKGYGRRAVRKHEARRRRRTEDREAAEFEREHFAAPCPDCDGGKNPCTCCAACPICNGTGIY